MSGGGRGIAMRPLHRMNLQEHHLLAHIRHEAGFLYDENGNIVMTAGRVLDCITAEREFFEARQCQCGTSTTPFPPTKPVNTPSSPGTGNAK